MPNQYNISPNTPTSVCGLMTGTSLDGIDVAICGINSEPDDKYNLELNAFEIIDYPDGFAENIKQLLEQPDWESISYLHFALPKLYAMAVIETAKRNSIDIKNIKLIGMHGQTVWHCPQPVSRFGIDVSSTLQLGDGSALAKLLNIPVVSNFRAADIALGGQGAPLVPRFDYDFFRSDTENSICLNIGGMANITILPKYCTIAEVTAYDTGPGNILIDLAMKSYFNLEYDKSGAMARSGMLCNSLLSELMDEKYIKQIPPKSTGRELFNSTFIKRHIATRKLAFEDIIATLTHYTAESIVANIRFSGIIPDKLIVSGGGAKNNYLMEQIAKLLPKTQVLLSDDFGISSDAKEAIAFAYLAWRTANFLPSNIPSVSGAAAETVLGSISF